jgi:hypothetical protein
MAIDDNREPVQNIYIQRVEKAGNNFVNAVFDTIKDVKAK